MRKELKHKNRKPQRLYLSQYFGACAPCGQKKPKFGADVIAGPNSNRTDSGYYPNYPLVRGYTSGYYRVMAPPADTIRTESEAKSRGFRFNANCNEFVVYNKWKSLQWAFQLGLFYRPQFGSIDDHFVRSMDPSKHCANFLKADYKEQFASLSKGSVSFYLQILLHYFKGLLQGSKFPYETLRIRFDDLLKLGATYGINVRTIGRLYPITQAQLAQEAARQQVLKTHPTTKMASTPSAQFNPFSGTYDYSGLGALALQYQ